MLSSLLSLLSSFMFSSSASVLAKWPSDEMLGEEEGKDGMGGVEGMDGNSDDEAFEEEEWREGRKDGGVESPEEKDFGRFDAEEFGRLGSLGNWNSVFSRESSDDERFRCSSVFETCEQKITREKERKNEM